MRRHSGSRKRASARRASPARLCGVHNNLEPFSAQAWQTWRIELPDGKNATKLDRPHIAGGIKFARVGDKVYQNESKADFSSTALVVTSEDDEPRSGLVVPGVPWNIVQVR